MPLVDKNIAIMNATIEEYEVQRNLYLATRKIDLPEETMRKLSKTNTSIKDLNEKTGEFVDSWNKKVVAAKDVEMSEMIKQEIAKKRSPN